MSCAANLSAPLGSPISPGVTNTITRTRPTKAEINRTKSLKACLSWYGVLEDIIDYQHRKMIIKRLESLFKEWLVEMCESMNVRKIVRDNVGGKVVPFGSFNLGVNSKDADINILCVGPEFLQRRDFITSFYEKLKAQEEFKNIQVIEEGLKMTYDGIEIDLVFARLKRRSVPEKVNLLDDRLLDEMDLQCVMALDCYRVSEEILKCVPNEENFRLALRAIRFWAKRRNIYSHKLGFFGGVSWAILMARICQLFPRASASILVVKFFSLLTQWSKKPKPVLLKTGVSGTFRGFQFWDPHTNLSDVVSIITPAYPQLNSTISVTRSTFGVIKEELKRGSAIAEDIWKRKASWSNLFETPNVLGGSKPKAKAKPQAPTVIKIRKVTKKKKCSDSEAPAKTIKTDKASAPTTPFKVPRAPKRQHSPCAGKSTKRLRLSEEAGPATKVTSRPVKKRIPKKRFDAYQSLTAKLVDAPPGPAVPVLVVKRGNTFQLLRACHGNILVCCSRPPRGWPVDVSSGSRSSFGECSEHAAGSRVTD